MAAYFPPPSIAARIVRRKPSKSRDVSSGVSSRYEPSVVVCATGRATRPRQAAVHRVVDVLPLVPVTPTVKSNRLHSGGVGITPAWRLLGGNDVSGEWPRPRC